MDGRLRGDKAIQDRRAGLHDGAEAEAVVHGNRGARSQALHRGRALACPALRTMEDT